MATGENNPEPTLHHTTVEDFWKDDMVQTLEAG
jgi:hypothetical protein